MNNVDNKEVTNAEILEFLREHMVMKEDAATKDDLKVFVTKEDLKNFVTKEDLKVTEDRIMARLSEFQAELEDIKIKLAAIESKLHEDTNALNDVLITEVAGLKKRVAFLEQKLGLPGFDFNGISV